MTRYYALDTETDLMNENNVPPNLVCMSLFSEDSDEPELYDCYDSIEIFRALAQQEDIHFVFHNAPFDIWVFLKEDPDLISIICQLMKEKRIHDTEVRERLLNLAHYGKLDIIETPDGGSARISYSLAALAERYLQKDRYSEKNDPTSPRLTFHEVMGVPISEYEPEFYEYAIEDAVDTLSIFQCQDFNFQDSWPEWLHVNAAISLFCMTARGIEIDEEKREQIRKDFADFVVPLEGDLVDLGIIDPAQPPRPYKNNSSKFTKGKPSKLNTKVLQHYVDLACNDLGIQPEKTAGGATSTRKGFLDEVADAREELIIFQQWKHTQKIITTELPRIEAKIVRPQYKSLVETGRTSSFGNRKTDKNPAFPAINCQNVDPRIRPAYRAREGYVLLSVDYSALELRTLAQTNFELFGHSTHRNDFINGVDPHARLGLNLYNSFNHTNLTMEEFQALDDYSTIRKNSKPGSLGFPGGLGPATFCKYAKEVWGIHLALEEGELQREIWFETYQEMREYFKYISSLEDRNFVDADGSSLFSYTTVLGMRRSGCTWSAAANGLGMQSRAGEGCKLASIELFRQTWDPSAGSILIDCFPLMFVHDEFILEVPATEKMSDYACAVSQVMIDCMQLVVPDVPIETEAVLSERWHKEAKPVFDAQGKLTIWRP